MFDPFLVEMGPLAALGVFVIVGLFAAAPVALDLLDRLAVPERAQEHMARHLHALKGQARAWLRR